MALYREQHYLQEDGYDDSFYVPYYEDTVVTTPATPTVTYTTEDLINAANQLRDAGYTEEQIRAAAAPYNIPADQLNQVITNIFPVVNSLPVPSPEEVLPQYPTNMIGDQERVDRGGGVMDVGRYILPNIPGIDLRENIGEDTVPVSGGAVVPAPVDQYLPNAQGEYSLYTDTYPQDQTYGGYFTDVSQDLTPVDTYTGYGNFGGGNAGADLTGSYNPVYEPNFGYEGWDAGGWSGGGEVVGPANPNIITDPGLLIGNEKGPEDYGTVITYPTEGGLPTDIESGTQVATGGAVGIGGTGNHKGR